MAYKKYYDAQREKHEREMRGSDFTKKKWCWKIMAVVELKDGKCLAECVTFRGKTGCLEVFGSE